jgi:hypothetical protein
VANMANAEGHKKRERNADWISPKNYLYQNDWLTIFYLNYFSSINIKLVEIFSNSTLSRNRSAANVNVLNSGNSNIKYSTSFSDEIRRCDMTEYKMAALRVQIGVISDLAKPRIIHWVDPWLMTSPLLRH